MKETRMLSAMQDEGHKWENEKLQLRWSRFGSLVQDDDSPGSRQCSAFCRLAAHLKCCLRGKISM